MKLGSHVSSSGSLTFSVSRAKAVGCECFQVFTSNPKGWDFRIRTDEEIKEFKTGLDDAGIKDVFGHTIYLVNFASSNPYIYTNSINSLISGLVLAQKAGFCGVVTHIGSHGGTGVNEGIERVVNALTQAINITEGKIPILLETDAGSGNHIGSKFSEIGKIIKKTRSDSVGVCLDTCHIFAAEYDITSKEKFDKMLIEFDKEIGLKNLGVLHLNDSKGDIGSHIDRHEEIGKGNIGVEMFRYIVNHPKLSHLCGIVETPDNKDTIKAEKLSLDILKDLRV